MSLKSELTIDSSMSITEEAGDVDFQHLNALGLRDAIANVRRERRREREEREWKMVVQDLQGDGSSDEETCDHQYEEMEFGEVVEESECVIEDDEGTDKEKGSVPGESNPGHLHVSIASGSTDSAASSVSSHVNKTPGSSTTGGPTGAKSRVGPGGRTSSVHSQSPSLIRKQYRERILQLNRQITFSASTLSQFFETHVFNDGLQPLPPSSPEAIYRAKSAREFCARLNRECFGQVKRNLQELRKQKEEVVNYVHSNRVHNRALRTVMRSSETILQAFNDYLDEVSLFTETGMLDCLRDLVHLSRRLLGLSTDLGVPSADLETALGELAYAGREAQVKESHHRRHMEQVAWTEYIESYAHRWMPQHMEEGKRGASSHAGNRPATKNTSANIDSWSGSMSSASESSRRPPIQGRKESSTNRKSSTSSDDKTSAGVDGLSASGSTSTGSKTSKPVKEVTFATTPAREKKVVVQPPSSLKISSAKLNATKQAVKTNPAKAAKDDAGVGRGIRGRVKVTTGAVAVQEREDDTHRVLSLQENTSQVEVISAASDSDQAVLEARWRAAVGLYSKDEEAERSRLRKEAEEATREVLWDLVENTLNYMADKPSEDGPRLVGEEEIDEPYSWPGDEDVIQTEEEVRSQRLSDSLQQRVLTLLEEVREVRQRSSAPSVACKQQPTSSLHYMESQSDRQFLNRCEAEELAIHAEKFLAVAPMVAEMKRLARAIHHVEAHEAAVCEKASRESVKEKENMRKLRLLQAQLPQSAMQLGLTTDQVETLLKRLEQIEQEENAICERLRRTLMEEDYRKGMGASSDSKEDEMELEPEQKGKKKKNKKKKYSGSKKHNVDATMGKSGVSSCFRFLCFGKEAAMVDKGVKGRGVGESGLDGAGEAVLGEGSGDNRWAMLARVSDAIVEDIIADVALSLSSAFIPEALFLREFKDPGTIPPRSNDEPIRLHL